jgi:hypothetical protein
MIELEKGTEVQEEGRTIKDDQGRNLSNETGKGTEYSNS